MRGAVLPVLGASSVCMGASVDIQSVTSGTHLVITGVGGSFAGVFAGQTWDGGSGVTGGPSAGLALAGANGLIVSTFSGFQSILPQPGHQGPLSLRLDSGATSLSWKMGIGDGGQVVVDVWSLSGALLGTQTFSGLTGIGTYSLSGFGVFQGVTFRDNTDAAGLRYYDFQYEEASVIPLPTGGALGACGLLAVWGRRRWRGG